MTTRVLGSASVGVSVPIAPLSLAQLEALLGPILSQVGTLTAQLLIQPKPPSIAQLGLSLAAAANPLTLAASVARLPSALISVQAGISAKLASLQALIDAANALLALIRSAIVAGGVAAYVYEGSASGMGDEMTANLGGGISGGTGGAASIQAIIFATEDVATFAALSQLLRAS